MYKSGVVIGKFMPLHKGHVHMLEFAKNTCEHLTILVDHLDGETISANKRVEVLKKTFPDSKITVKKVSKKMPQSPDEHPAFWDIWREEIRQNSPDNLDVIVGAMDYVKDLANVLSVDFLMIDKQRNFMPISATEIRDNPIKNWKYLAPHSKELFVKKVVVIGGESTGKTTLTKALADSFETVWVPEYARTAIEEDNKCDLSTFQKIINGQHSLMTAMLPHAHNGVIFYDTDLLATEIWLRKMFPKSHTKMNQELFQLTQTKKPDLYVLTNNEVDWISDDVRFYPENENREWFINEFEQELIKRKLPYIKLKSASLEERVQEVNDAIKDFFS